MMRVIFSIAIFYFISQPLFAQQTREELERQRKELKKQIDESQTLLNSVNAETKSSLSVYTIYNNKAELQGRVVNTFVKDLNILDNNIYSIQKDVNKYDRLLDTLKQEYAKSMIYAYKNRGSYEFLNFIFSADNFNDAIKRIAYLKSYRTYREMQGQNILRMQDLRKKRLVDLGASKATKKTSLEMQKEEMDKLAEQKEKQANIVAQLKKQGQNLNSSIAARQKQMGKVNNAIKVAIAKALREEREKERVAALAELKRQANIKAEEDRKLRIKNAELDKIAREAAKKAGAKDPVVKTTEPTKVPGKVIKEPRVKVPEPVVLASESVALNASIERNKGILPWPVDNPSVLNHYGLNKFDSQANFMNDGVTIAAPVGSAVKSVFQGTVILVLEPIEEGKYVVMVKNGSYFFSYVNISNITVKQGDAVKTGQLLGKVAANMDGIGAIDFKAARGNTDLNPEQWLRRR